MSFDSILGGNTLSEVGSGVGTKFNSFLSKLELTTVQKQEAIFRHTKMRANLEKVFTGSRSFMAGSYAKNTAIRPPSDLDIMLVLPYTIYQKYTSYPYIQNHRNAQSEFLQEVKGKIQLIYPNTTMKADGQVIVVMFSGSFSVEIVPCFQTGILSDKYTIADTNNGGSWRHVNPVSEAISLTVSNKLTNGNAIKLIKMMKCWKRFCKVPLKSFHIEILVQEFLSNYRYKDKCSVYYDWMLRDFFEWLSNKYSFYGVVIYHPSTFERVDIGSFWGSKVDSALVRARKAIEFESEKMPFSAKGEWQKIFGFDYGG